MIRIFMMAFLAVSCLCLPVSTAFAASDFSSRAAGMAEIKSVRVHASGDNVRIVVDADKEVDYKTMVLKQPGRVVVDLSGAWLSAKAVKDQPIQSQFASRVRVAQHNASTVRVVVETTMGSNAENFDVFSLTGGSSAYRVVMDFGNLDAGQSGTAIKFPKKAGTTEPAAEKKDEPKSETQKQSEQTAEDAGKDTPAATPEQTAKSEGSYSTAPGISGKRIAIDAGHGGNDTGAIGAAGTTEKSVTLRIAQKVRQLLEASGAKVFMTRTTDTEVSPKHANASDDEELQARCDVANNNNADIFVCIHMDSFSSSAARGTTGYYYADASQDGIRLADAVRAGVVGQLGTDSRGTKSCHFYVVKHTTMPATLVEVAFISNPQEEKLLNTDDGVLKAAQGIVDGIAAYFK